MNELTKILNDLRRGKMIILVDSEDRENEGDIIVAAEFATPKVISFMAKYGRGLICAPMTAQRAQELDLHILEQRYATPLQRCNFTESVDARSGISTGISAQDRARTVSVLLNKKTKAADMSRPGHLFPLVVDVGGVLARRGHTEGTLYLMELAGLKPMGVLCEIMGDDGTMLRGAALKKFASHHGLSIMSIDTLVAHRQQQQSVVKLLVESRLPTSYGEFKIRVYSNEVDKKEHLAMIKGKISKKTPVLVRVHSECLTGDVMHSVRCDCYYQLNAGLEHIEKNGSGVLIYLRQEGRGIGLVNKLKAYNLQDKGYDTVQANVKLGFKADARDYTVAAQILCDLGISKIRLITNNPEKIECLKQYGITVTSRVPLEMDSTEKGRHDYLVTKKRKMGHLFSKL